MDLFLQIPICLGKGKTGHKLVEKQRKTNRKRWFFAKTKEKNLNTTSLAYNREPQITKFRPYFNVMHTNSNLYHYAGNNPVHYIDPDGKKWVCLLLTKNYWINEILWLTEKQQQDVVCLRLLNQKWNNKLVWHILFLQIVLCRYKIKRIEELVSDCKT